MKDNWQTKIDELNEEIIALEEMRKCVTGESRNMVGYDLDIRQIKLTQLQEAKTLHEQELKNCQHKEFTSCNVDKRQDNSKFTKDRFEPASFNSQQELKSFAEDICKRAEKMWFGKEGIFPKWLKEETKQILSERLGKNEE